MNTQHLNAVHTLESLGYQHREGLYIAGKRRPASTGATIAVVDPSTEMILARVPDASIEDGRAVIDAAANAAEGGAAPLRASVRKSSAAASSG